MRLFSLETGDSGEVVLKVKHLPEKRLPETDLLTDWFNAVVMAMGVKISRVGLVQ
jgi:hypothetical protein